MSHNVRGHTRRTRSGGTSTVRQHKRTGPNPGHAWKMAKKSAGHGRKGRKGLMVGFGLFAILEIVLWVTANVTGVVAGVAGALLLGLAFVLTNRSGSQW